jgi:hypothetical protein
MTIRIDRLSVEMHGGDARSGRLLAAALSSRLGALTSRTAQRASRNRVVSADVGGAGGPALTAQRIVDEIARQLARP